MLVIFPDDSKVRSTSSSGSNTPVIRNMLLSTCGSSTVADTTNSDLAPPLALGCEGEAPVSLSDANNFLIAGKNAIPSIRTAMVAKTIILVLLFIIVCKDSLNVLLFDQS